MPRLAEAMSEARISRRALARAAGLSIRAAHDLVRLGQWPKRQRVEDVAARVRTALTGLGMAAGVANDAGLFEESPGPRGNAAPADTTTTGNTTTEVHMLITKRSLSNAAREQFGVPAQALMPPASVAEVFLAGEMRVGFEHLLAKAKFGGVLALAGESGAGKTTLKDLLITQLADEGAAVVVIEPHVQAMEANDKAGKTLKAAALVEAILREVAPTEKLKSSSEARLAQVEAALARSAEQDARRRHLMIIDEAHCLPIPTLKHLKRFMEFKRKKVGLQPPLLTIVLIGQPELKLRLSTYDREVREVWQRCEVVTLQPLDRELGAYLKHRLGPAATAFGEDAVDELRLVLSGNGRSFAYPLAIDNWAAAILNTAAKVKAPRITAAMVRTALKEVEDETKAIMGGR